MPNENDNLKTASGFMWENKSIDEQLNSIYEYTLKCVNKEKNWYVAQAKKFRKYAIGLRTCSVILLIVSTILPLLVLEKGITIGKMGSFVIDPKLTTITLILAGGFYTFDKIMGVSTAWMRYISAQINITARIEEFIIDWNDKMLASGKVHDLKEAKEMVKICNKLVSAANKVVKEETDEWIIEFKAISNELEGLLKSTKDNNGKEEL